MLWGVEGGKDPVAQRVRRSRRFIYVILIHYVDGYRAEGRGTLNFLDDSLEVNRGVLNNELLPPVQI